MNDKKKSPRVGLERQSSGPKGSQRGGFAVGLIIGLLIGLALALGVALYVTKVPVPFVNKVPQRSAGQDAAEAEKNKNWDPNSPLYGKNPAKPMNAASGTVEPLPPVVAPQATLPAPAVTGNATPALPRASAPQSERDPAAILADKPVAPKITSTAAPGNSSDPFSYYVQAGAYGRTEDAEQQRAKLAMMGLEGKLTEREQSGHTVYRVRVGPFDKKADADAAKDKLVAGGLEAALVRVQR
jgi:cell division protein FtsN